ncbi:MAG TPA: asparaginase [Planctomycetota bacterium]|nr:asparaginase [Planctomycetota bacterium]
MGRKPSILLVTTGGTFGMLPGGEGFLRSVLRAAPEARRIADLDVRSPFALDSSSLTPDHWVALARLIAAEMDRYDGFVVTHGTDTLAYTAAALSFMLEGLRKPVVLTGAQRPLAEIRNDARANLIDAVETATRAIPEVCVAFGGVVLRGNRCRKWSLSDYRAFTSPNFPPLGEVGADFALHKNRLLRPRRRFRLRPEIDPRVLHLKLAPGLCGSRLDGLDLSTVRGVVLEAFGAGNVPLDGAREIFPMTELTRRGVTVLVVSGSEHGRVDLERYAGGRAAARAAAVSGGDLTAECAVVKLMCALGRAKDARAVRRELHRDWAGETG